MASAIEKLAIDLIADDGTRFDEIFNQLMDAVTDYFHVDRQLKEQYRKAADEIYGREGELEIDDDAVVSLSETQLPEEGDPRYAGAYVHAWRWVDADELHLYLENNLTEEE